MLKNLSKSLFWGVNSEKLNEQFRYKTDTGKSFHARNGKRRNRIFRYLGQRCSRIIFQNLQNRDGVSLHV